jgi:hypothetical protein
MTPDPIYSTGFLEEHLFPPGVLYSTGGFV